MNLFSPSPTPFPSFLSYPSNLGVLKFSFPNPNQGGILFEKINYGRNSAWENFCPRDLKCCPRGGLEG